jgi:hypothetical protein
MAYLWASLVKKAQLSAQSKRCEWFAVWMTGPRLILLAAIEKSKL